MNFYIDINIEKSLFVISGEIEALIKNKRFLISLKRLGFFIEIDFIYITNQVETQIYILH